MALGDPENTDIMAYSYRERTRSEQGCNAVSEGVHVHEKHSVLKRTLDYQTLW